MRRPSPASPVRPAARRRPAPRLAVTELLESRRMLAAFDYSASITGSTVTFTGSVNAAPLTFDQSGGILRHNRKTAGDSNFTSDFDFDSTVAGDQTLSSTDPAFLVIVNAGGSQNTITIGTPAAPATSLAASFQVNGNSDTDALFIDDSASSTGRTVTLNGDTRTVNFGLGPTITYAVLENLTLSSGGGSDTLNVVGAAPALINLNAGGGNDTVDFANGATLGGVADGGTGTNTLDYGSYATPVTLNLSSGSATGTGGVTNFSHLIGGSAGDTLTGNTGANAINGGPGADSLDGGDGNDTLTGGPGGDQLLGGDNDDRFVWNNGDGSDVMDGQGGNDTVVVNGSTTAGDQFLLQAQSSRLTFSRTNLGPFTLDIGTAESLEVNGDVGDDTLTVDFVGGNPIPTSGLLFDAAQGTNRLVLQRSGGSYSAIMEEFTQDSQGVGTIEFDSHTIHYLDAQTVDDTVPALVFSYFGLSAGTSINVADGPEVSGFQTTQLNSPDHSFEPINVARKTHVNVFGASGAANTFTVSHPHPATGLTGLTLNGALHAPDTFVVTPSSVAITLNGELPSFPPGDTAFVDLTGIPESALVDTGAGQFTYGFGSNREPITFEGIETITHSPHLTIDDVTQAEGNAGQTTFTFTVTRASGDLTRSTTVNYSIAAGTASADTDFQPAAGTLTFDPGQSSKTITVTVSADTAVEGDETFLVNLTSPTNALIDDAQGLGTITNDDADVPPATGLSVNDPSVSEGNAGTRNLTFTVTLAQASSQTVSVKYKTASGTAKAAADYLAASGTLTFAPGQTTKTVSVKVKGDTTLENNETVRLVLSSPTNTTLDRATGTGQILNDDRPALSIRNASVKEGNAGNTVLTFNVKLSRPTTANVSVKFTTRDNTAKTSNKDYTAQSDTLKFAPGEVLKTISILIKGDARKEPNETLSLLLTNPTNAFLQTPTAIGTITNDD